MVEGHEQAALAEGTLPGQDAQAVEGGEARRDPRRSRDRYGRDRRDRQPREDAPAGESADQQPQAPADAGERRPRYGTAFVNEESTETRAAAAAAPIAPIAVQPPAARPAAAPAPRGLPKVQPFQLPVEQLAQIATGSGLQWVNSDAEKIAAVQAAIAAEPKPIHVPRERPPVVEIDEGPLVLVETRRDLSEMKLPFEQQPPAPLQ